MPTVKSKSFWLLLFVGAIALSFLLYGNNLKGGFVYDDHFFADRPELRDSAHLLKVWTEPYLPQNLSAGLYRPFAVFSFALNFILFGESALSFHIVNIVLNGAVIFLVALLVFKLFQSWPLAVFSGFFFAFLPIHSESVAFIKSRDEILAALFAVWSWLLFISATEGKSALNWKKITTSALLFLLAVFSKELIIIAPALFLAAFWARKKPKFLLFLKAASGFLIIGFFYLWLRFQILGPYAFGEDKSYFAINPLGYADFWTRIWTAFKIAFIYIGKTFAPINLSATYHFNHLTLVNNPFLSWQSIVGAILLVALITTAVHKKTRATPLGIGALSFFIPYLVISKIIFKSGDILAERWMYFPSVGLSIIGGYLLFLVFQRRKRFGLALAMAVFSAYAFILVPRNQIWSSDVKLFNSMIKTAPRSVQGHSNLANLYLRNDRLEEARREAEIAFEIDKEYPPLLNTIGAIAFKDENYDLAETAFLKAIELAPHLPLGYINVGRLYYKIGQYERAKEMFETALGAYIRPKTEDVLVYVLTLAKLKEYRESINTINKYLGGSLDNSHVRLALAINYFKMGNIAEAKKYFDWTTGKTEKEKIEILRIF